MSLASPALPIAFDQTQRRHLPAADRWLTLLLVAVLLGPVGQVGLGGSRMTLFWSDLTMIPIVIGLAFKQHLAIPRAVWWYTLYLLVVFVSLRMNDEPTRNFVILLKLEVAPLLVLIFVYNYATRERATRALIVQLVWFGAALAVITMINWVRIQNGAIGPYYHPDRVMVLTAKDAAQTSFGRSNYIASMLIVLIPLALYKTAKAKTAWGAVAAMLVALIATQSRGGLISLAVAFLVWLGLSLRYLPSSLKTLVGLAGRVMVCLAVLIAVWRYLPNTITADFAKRLVETREHVASGDYAGNRRGAWIPAAMHVLDAPLVGIGYGNEEANPTALDMNAGSAHNLYLQVLLATGVLGFIPLGLFLWSCGAAWFGILRSSLVMEDRALAAAALFLFTACLINSFEEPSFWGLEYSRVLWIILGLGFVIRHRRISSGQYRVTHRPSGMTAPQAGLAS